MATRALVLGGSGVAGIAWELGLLSGWATEGVTIKGTQSAHELTWQMDSGRVTVRPAPDAPPTTLVTVTMRP